MRGARKRLPRLMGIAAVASVFSALLPAAPAGAHEYQGTDWRNIHTICSTCSIRRGDLIGLWQSILWADNMTSLCTSQNPNGVDGSFGSRARMGTISWQRIYMGSAAGDGIVGPRTWSRADDYLVYEGSENRRDYFVYAGVMSRTIPFVRLSNTTNPPLLWNYRNPANPTNGNNGRGGFGFTHPDILFYTC